MRALTKEWLKAANDDLMTIKEIINNQMLTHIVAFHAQQCIEKVFKALLEESQTEIPKIHNLNRLWSMLPLPKPDVDENIIFLLDQLYIDSRYPGDFGLLPDGKPTPKDAKEFYDFAENIYQKTLLILEQN